MSNTLEESAIQKKTLELCQAITSHPDFGSLRSRVEGFLGNEAAKSQYQALAEQGQFLEHRQQTGGTITPAEIQEFEGKREAALGNTVIRSFLEAQQEIQLIQRFVNDYVSKTFELGRTPTEDDFHGGDCGSGCGCEH